MFKLPTDVKGLSMSSKIQWVIIGILYFYAVIFIQLTGISTIGSALGLAPMTFWGIALMATGLLVFELWIGYKNSKKEIASMMKAKEAAEATEPSEGRKQKSVTLTVNDVDKTIVIDYPIIEGVPDEEIVKEIINQYFDNMVLVTEGFIDREGVGPVLRK